MPHLTYQQSSQLQQLIRYHQYILLIKQMGSPHNRSLLWFCVAMAAALIVYSIARHQLWLAGHDCVTLDKTQDLEGEAYILNRQINKCRTASGGSYNELFQHNSKRLEDCQRLANDLDKKVADIKATKQCNSAQCYQELEKCQKNVARFFQGS